VVIGFSNLEKIVVPGNSQTYRGVMAFLFYLKRLIQRQVFYARSGQELFREARGLIDSLSWSDLIFKSLLENGLNCSIGNKHYFPGG
jgi:hypothetical protein